MLCMKNQIFKEAAISFLCADLSEARGSFGVLFVMIW